MDVMSIITRQQGRRRTLGREEEASLYADFQGLGRRDSVNELAMRYGVARSTVYAIARRFEEETARPQDAPDTSGNGPTSHNPEGSPTNLDDCTGPGVAGSDKTSKEGECKD